MSYKSFVDGDSRNPKISLKIIDGDECFDSVLLEADAESLLFLSDLIAAVANDDGLKNLSISPDGAGLAYFSSGSKLGLYIRKTEP